jgi:hypothetical protein
VTAAGTLGRLDGTLNPMNPYATSRTGLRRLKKQYGK